MDYADSDPEGCGPETCNGSGQCVHAFHPPSDDGNPCTVESCDYWGPISWPLNPGDPCPDGDLCNGDEVCDGAAACVAGAPPVVNDSNPCTADSCHPAAGILHTPVAAGTSCSDGNICNGMESCDGAGACFAGGVPVLDDGNRCTIDACDPVLGVVHEPVPVGTACGDSNVCNGQELCDGGLYCMPGIEPVLEDGDSCTQDLCDPTTGVAHLPIPNCGVLPPDPTMVASPLDPTVPTDIASATAFLYTGSNPIQTDVADGAIEARRVAIVRGLVTGRDGTPIPGVTISILGHAEFGRTLTREDGRFDIAVNGGGLLTLDYQKDGFLPAQRQVQAPWRDYVSVEDVVLVPFDVQVTPVASGAATMQSARGSIVTDSDGTRQATLLFPAGTQAAMRLQDGSTVPLGMFHVRATEYTVGTGGSKAMPAPLPPTSGYTYAVELSIDEAVAAGATTVEFDRPVAFYVENFLGFVVGGIVPVGYYDRGQGLWIPSDNGKVIGIVGVTNGLADLDTDGDDAADPAGTLTSLGVTDEERAQLGAMYAPGISLWRVPIRHFSPWDCNWPFGCEGTCPPPDPTPPPPPEPLPDPDEDCGSVIGCENQSLGESVEVVGTPYRLHYSSVRVAGYGAGRSVTVPLSGATLPSNVLSIELRIEIAGRRIEHSFPPLPNQKYHFSWDGLDPYGRPVQGVHPAVITIGWVYRSVYLQPSARSGARSFAAMSAGPAGAGSVFLPVVTRDQATPFWRTRTWRVNLTAWDGARALPVGGWSLDVHHVFDAASGTLWKGDGTARRPRELLIRTTAGTTRGGGGDGGPATSARLNAPTGIAIAPDGTLYIADTGNASIRRVLPTGVIETFAGTYLAGYSGDGGPATAARLNSPTDVAVAPDGTVFIADTGNNRIRRVGRDGLITTVAGTGEFGDEGDGGPAVAAQLSYIAAIALGPDGSLFISHNARIRRVGPDGIITTVAGTGAHGYGGDGGPAVNARLYGPRGVVVGRDGALFIADAANRRIRRVGADGIINTIAGTGAIGHEGDGGPANLAVLTQPTRLALGSDGSLFFSDTSLQTLRVRKIGPDGVISTIAGSGAGGSGGSGDGGPATSAGLAPYGVAVGGGAIFVSDPSDCRIRVLRPAIGGDIGAGADVTSEDGREFFLFHASGRHLSTLDARTRAAIYSFEYDAVGRLRSVTDRDGFVTTIEHAGEVPVAIVGPHGQRTTLASDASGYLSAVVNPANETRGYSYDANGLMRTYTDRRNHVHRFHYDPAGRLLRDESPAGGSKSLLRTESPNGYSVTVSTALGRATAHRVETLGTGAEVRTLTSPDGTALVRTDDGNGSRSTLSPDGTLTNVTLGPDPQFGMVSPLATATTVATPSGLTMSRSASASIVLADPSDLRSVVLERTDTRATNGRSVTSTYDAATRTITAVTAAGRQNVLTLDATGRVGTMQFPGVPAIVFARNSAGQVRAVTQGSRTSAIDYDTAGLPWRLTDPLGRQVELTYDAAGRVTTQRLPGARTVEFGYDPSGNLTALTPPGRPAHGFGFDAADRVSAYTPPPAPGTGLVATTYGYDLDGGVQQVLLPGEDVVSPAYDSAGRLSAVTTARGTSAIGYDTAGRVATVTAPDDVDVDYGYDGSLLTSEAWTGILAGAVSWTYDTDFRVATTSVNGASVSYQYDPDSLLTAAGALSIGRDAASGRISGTTLGSVSTTLSYNGYGELETHDARAGGSTIFSYTLARDAAGRIVGKTETVEGVTTTYAYGFDPAGRLETVTRNGQQIASYVNDDNGNRLSATITGVGTATGTYDEQDRMTAYGAASYTYGPSGDLRTKTAGTQTTTYSYDSLGNLMGVWLPDGRVTEYVVDGLNRRIGKKVNGVLAEGFLYEGQLRPVAWLDGNGQVYARFVYGLRVNVPEYMVTGAGTFRFLTDHLGSVRLVVNASTGAVAQRIDYDEWGRVLADTNPGFQPFGFAGGLYDRDTGLVRFGARDYDAQTGRWTSKDPILFHGGDTNLYVYVANNPISYFDPHGLEYNDLGFTFGVLGGSLTVGFLWGHQGFAAYYGLGVGTPGFGVSFTGSADNIVGGKGTSFQVGFGFAYQTGTSADGTTYHEFGAGTPGVGYYPIFHVVPGPGIPAFLPPDECP